MCAPTGPDCMVGKDDELKNLAITILFGDRFVDGAGSQLLTALHHSPEAVGEILLTGWGTGDTVKRFEARAVA